MKNTLLAWCVLLLIMVAEPRAEILDQPTDIDLTDVVKAINFGDTTDQVIGGVTFYAAPANSTVDGVKNAAQGMVKVGQHGQTLPEVGSSKEDDALEQILATSVFGCQSNTDIDLDIPVANGFYRVQLLLYDGWQSTTGNRRDVNHLIEGTLAVANYQDYVAQGTTPNAGCIATYVFEVKDGQIDITLPGLVPNAHLSGLVVSKVAPAPGRKTPELGPDDIWVVPTPSIVGEPELVQQYETLKRDLARRAKFDQVAHETLCREALILDTDRDPTDVVLRRTAALLADIRAKPTAPDLSGAVAELEDLLAIADAVAVSEVLLRYELFEEVCKLRRRIAFSNPLLDFDEIVFIKRHGSLYSHMVDQFYGMTAQPGGGLYVLADAFSENPQVRDVLADAVVERGHLEGQKLSGGPSRKWDISFYDNAASLRGEETKGGAFLSPDLSFDGEQILFAYAECRGSREHLAHTDFSRGHWDEGRCYHVFKVNVDGSGLEQLTDGTFNDFDPCWMPSGRIIFNSERCGGYLRCGRVCPTYTLHDMAADGSDIRRLSFHETHEWHPSVSHGGRVLYTRWDYVDRWSSAAHMPWVMMPDGRDPRAIQGNYTDRMTRPDMEVDVRAIPDSQKLIATATGHHSQVFGSLVVVDPRVVDDDQMSAVRRLTPDVGFPENQTPPGPDGGWDSHYGEAWPLSEDYYLCVYDPRARITPNTPLNASYGIYLLDSFGNRELIYRDPEISSHKPIPLRPRPMPPALPDGSERVAEGKPADAVVGVVNVYNSRKPWPEGTKIKALRVYQIFPLPIASWAVKHNVGLQIPGTNSVNITRAVLGTVPVEEDGSVHFIAPARKQLFFQALDERGMAIQTMRSGTQFMPGEKATCQGCHEPTHAAVTAAGASTPLAMRRTPSRLKPDVDGTNPFSYPRLVQPVLDKHCVECHATHPDKPMRLDAGLVEDPAGGWMNTPTTYYASYLSLAPKYGAWRYTDSTSGRGIDRDLNSTPGKVGARASKLYGLLDKGHYDVKLSPEDLHRITVWLDSYSPFYGVYGPEAGKAQLRGEVVRPALE